MNHGKLRLFALCMAVLLLSVACQSKAPTILPVTGVQDAASAQVTLARDNVLKYIYSSSRLESLPKDIDWQPDADKGSGKEFCFRSGDWQMIILPADQDDENQRVIITNNVEHAAWTGYVTPKGHVVDTAYGR